MRSADNGITFRGTDQVWCGSGWTGQPNVIQHPNGVLEVRDGAYDDHYHFLNGLTGRRSAAGPGDGRPGEGLGDQRQRRLPPLLRRLARQLPPGRRARPSAPTVLWKFNSRLARRDRVERRLGRRAAAGRRLPLGGQRELLVLRDPPEPQLRLASKVAGRPPDRDARPGLGRPAAPRSGRNDKDVSIENSVAFDANRASCTSATPAASCRAGTSATSCKGGTHYSRVFRFWDGDETDASIVIDANGDLIVARHRTENVPVAPIARDQQVGRPDEARSRASRTTRVVWSVQLGGFEPEGGILGTPALYKGVVYATWNEGGVAAIDAATGQVYWKSGSGPPGRLRSPSTTI